MRVETFLRKSAETLGDKTALVAGQTRLSYHQLDRMSDQLAATLVARGIERGDRVVVFMDNCWEAVVAIFAVLKAGAVFSPVNPSTKAEKLAFILGNCRARGLIAPARLVAVVDAALAAAPSVQVTVLAGEGNGAAGRAVDFAEAIAVKGPVNLPAPGIDIDLAMLIYTSGSTGFPKGVMMTHHNVEAAARSITTYLENTADDIILNVLPISFDYGLYQVLMSVMTGGTLVLEKSFAFPHPVLQKIRDERVTGFPIVPTMAALILQMKGLQPDTFASLRYITNTAAALAPSVIERLRVLFPATRIYSMYGLTECKRCTWLPPAELDRRPDSVGIAIPGTEAYVVDEEGREVPPGVVGELVIRGPHVMQGYWENDEATRRALRPGRYPWERVLYTGDLFRTDEDGFLYFIGRTDDIIKTRGEKVSPREVENVLHALPGVGEAVVIGISDPVLGQAIKAVIAPMPDSTLSERDVLRHCARHLEDFMVPKQVEFRTVLPKTETGKVSRRLIRETTECAG